MIDTIIDIHHSNAVDFDKVKKGGVIAVIHKATEGATWQDPAYHERRAQARALNLLWGCYHFSSGASVPDQVENFLKYANPQDDEFISLDWEGSHSGPDMTLEQARDFVQIIRGELGRWPCLYGGDVMRSAVNHQADPILSQCPLWYVRYAESPIAIPTAIWPTYALWQYTDGTYPTPTPTVGASGADRSRFQGTGADMNALWPFTKKAPGTDIGPGLAHLLANNP